MIESTTRRPSISPVLRPFLNPPGPHSPSGVEPFTMNRHSEYSRCRISRALNIASVNDLVINTGRTNAYVAEPCEYGRS